MPTYRARLRRVLPSFLPALLVIVFEVALAVGIVLYWASQQHALCVQLQASRAASSQTLRGPLRDLARATGHPAIAERVAAPSKLQC